MHGVLRLVTHVRGPEPDHRQRDHQGEDEEPCTPIECDVVAVDAGRLERGGVHRDRVAGCRVDGHGAARVAGEDLRDDRAEQREPDRAADLLTGVEQRAGHAGVTFLDAMQCDGLHRDEDEAHTAGDQHLAREHGAQPGAVGVELGEVQQPGDTEGGAPTPLFIRPCCASIGNCRSHAQDVLTRMLRPQGSSVVVSVQLPSCGGAQERVATVRAVLGSIGSVGLPGLVTTRYLIVLAVPISGR